MAVDKEKAREAARSLLIECRIDVAPVPVERIARSRGISIQYAPLDDELSGMAFIKDNAAVIGVNSLHHPNRQRFTIAHELGHHLLHKEHLSGEVHVDKIILKRDVLAHSGTDQREIEANAFASELLMPEHMIMTAISTGIDIGDEAKLASIAKKFKVSTAALQYRLMT